MRTYLSPAAWEPLGRYWHWPGYHHAVLVLSGRARNESGEPPIAIMCLREDDPDFAAHERAVFDRGGFLLTGEDPRDARMSPVDAFGLQLHGDTLADALFRFIRFQSDPQNCDSRAPQIPGDGLRNEIWLAGVRLRSQRFRFGWDGDYDRIVTDQLRRQLNEYREAAFAGLMVGAASGQVEYDYHRKCMAATLDQFARHGKREELFRLLAKGWGRYELPLPHDTVLTDSFDRANQTGLGTSDGGFTYTTIAGTSADILSNAASGVNTSGSFTVRLDADMSSSNNFSQISITQQTGDFGAGCNCRYNTGGYGFILRRTTNNKRRVFGSGGEIAGDTTASTPTYTAKISAGEGASDTVKAYVGGVVILTVTDSSFTTGLRGAFNGANSTTAGNRSIQNDLRLSDVAGSPLIGGGLIDPILVNGALVR